MKIYQFKQMINAFDNYYNPNWEPKYVGNNYVEVLKLCNDLMLDDKAEGNY